MCLAFLLVVAGAGLVWNDGTLAETVIDPKDREILFERLGTGYTVFKIYRTPRHGGPTRARLHLKFDALQSPISDLLEDQAIIRALGFPQGYQDILAGVIDWWKDLEQRDADSIYEEAKVLADPKGPAIAGHLATALLRLAADRGSNLARYDLAQKSADPASTLPSLFGLQQLGDDGYLPAQLDLARRYIESDGTKYDPMRSFYWLLRADQNGGEVSQLLSVVREKANPSDIETALDRLRNGRAPFSYAD